MNRKVRDRIFNEIKLSGTLEKNYVVELIKTYDERPDVNKLVEQHYKSKADGIVASFKDENGIRDCFAVKTANNKTKYIDLSRAQLLNIKEIELVRIKQENGKRSKDEIIKKTDVSKRVIMGQVKIEDYSKVLKEELAKEVI